MKCFSKIFFSIYTADFFNINIFVYVLYLFYSVQADALWPLWVFESQWLCELRDLWGSDRGQIFICWMGYFGHWIGRITVDSTKISKQCESSLNTCTNTYPQTPPPVSQNHLRHEPLMSWVNRCFERYGFVGNWTDSEVESGLLMFIYLFCCTMSRDNETLWPRPMMTSPLVLSGPGCHELQ